MFGEVVSQKSVPIYHEDRGWIIKVHKHRALYQVQCSDGNLTQEEIYPSPLKVLEKVSEVCY